ncbi:head-tail connector protein [Parerythrobacter jejuensis]|uniref:Phage gp6-like head-tail connector protein n=1 Tax=Parerythrobacter jejuensis TaxID=795812 RepID=A0A845AVA3_9SPHN|nr:phage head-tail connector protein [Parerythrobacter jejuensis]MXP30758.1 hypothetical protein [Parerythrobacter jejuensis]MXP33518.1 hypothetical protein [Parerythrobacter jejuensis]
MKRAIVAPAILGGAPLAELKHWLAISTSNDDASLEALLRSALETCEAFTGTMPLAATVEETLPASRNWQGLHTCPVRAILAVEGIPAEGSRITFAIEDYDIDLDPDSRGLVRLLKASAAGRIAVQFEAGLADDWEELPDGLRHGILRLAAHHYRSRESGADPTPPAAVAALWRPWRRMRIA